MPAAGQNKTFSLERPGDLLQKLWWETRELYATEPQEFNVLAYRALNCALTAWHITDWLFASLTSEQRRTLEAIAGRSIRKISQLQTWVREQERSIHVCRQLATAAKHFEVITHPDPNVTTSTHEVTQSGDSIFIVSSVVVRDGFEELQPIVIASRAYEHWRRLFTKLRVPHYDQRLAWPIN